MLRTLDYWIIEGGGAVVGIIGDCNFFRTSLKGKVGIIRGGGWKNKKSENIRKVLPTRLDIFKYYYYYSSDSS